MSTTELASPVFHEGDAVVLAKGSYQGTVGVFLRLKEDAHWADITEPGGVVRSHPVEWLALAKSPVHGG